MIEQESLLKQLQYTRRTLALLEGQAAGYSSLTTPTHLIIELEDKRREVADLETKIKQNSEHYGESADQTPSTIIPNRAVSTSAKVFISYSHKNMQWLKRLQVHLRPYEQFGWTNKDGSKQKLEIVIWDDTLIQPGQNWRNEIIKALNTSEVAVLFISPDFMASQLIDSEKLPSLLASSNENGLRVLPIVIEPTTFKSSWIAKYQFLNSPSYPLSEMPKSRQEETFARIAEAIISALRS